MTRMLASVNGPEEAEIALAGGADIIDLKDPTKGALGAVTPEGIRATVKAVGKRRPVSAVAGDLPMQPGLVAATVRDIAATGVDYVKLGIFPGGRRPRLHRCAGRACGAHDAGRGVFCRCVA